MTATRPEGCICPQFSDTGGFRIGDLCCPVHGVGGTQPLDGAWEQAPAAGRASLANDHDFMHPGQLHAPGHCTSCDRKRDEVSVRRADLRAALTSNGVLPDEVYDRLCAAAGMPS